MLVSDGIISEADQKAGGPSLAAFLPAGEVYTTPVPGSARARSCTRAVYFRGKPIDNLTLTVEGGKVTAMTGDGPGYPDFKAEYDAVTDARKDQFGFIDFGINPNVSAAGEQHGRHVGAGGRGHRRHGQQHLGRRRQLGALRDHRVPAGQHGHAGWQGDRRERRAEAVTATRPSPASGRGVGVRAGRHLTP